MSNIYQIEYTDTFGGEANYSWVKRATIAMPELTHYGYTGSADGTYSRANKAYNRELMRKAKAAMGLTGMRGTVVNYGDTIEFRPYRHYTVLFINWSES